jgi:hypothetical protein
MFTVENFKYAFVRNDEPDEEKKCGRWRLRSPETHTFTLEEASTSGWRVWTGEVEDTCS